MDLLLRNVRPWGRAPVDVLCRQGRIAQVGPGLAVGPGIEVEDGAGLLLLPGLVESHAHLDKTLWGLPWYVNEVGPQITDRIANERRWRAASGHDAGAQSLVLAREFLARGTTRLRTHVDVDTEARLRHLRGVLGARERLAGMLEMQVVAFPQSGLLARPGTAELLDEALAAGADVLGGLDPQGIDGDAQSSLDVLFGLAERHGVPLDIHLHEAGESGAATLDAILDRTDARGLQDRVAISHAFCLGDVDHGLEVGCRADLVLVDARHPQEAVVARPPRRLVISAGRIVAREGRLISSATIMGFNDRRVAQLVRAPP